MLLLQIFSSSPHITYLYTTQRELGALSFALAPPSRVSTHVCRIRRSATSLAHYRLRVHAKKLRSQLLTMGKEPPELPWPKMSAS
jgi:hypothetical protein